MKPLTRREFLYYVWGASIALLTAEITFVLRPRYGLAQDCFDFCYVFSVDDLPPPDGQPYQVRNSKSRPEFWLVNVGPTTSADPRHPAGVSVQPEIGRAS